jgi:hypothetical protein
MDGGMTDDQMGSADEAMHEQMAELYRQQALEATANREAFATKEAFKNRTLIHSKLDRETYSYLWAYAKAHDLSINSAIKQILQNHFNISPES